MALRSMTGYGRGSAAKSGARVEVQASSVNRRQLDIHINLPRTLAPLESRVTEEVRSHITRGRINLEVRVTHEGQSKRDGIQINEELAAAYLRDLRRTAGRLGLPDNLQADVLLTLPDVVRFTEVEPDVERIWPPLQRAVRAALRAVDVMRKSEGESLQADIAGRIERLRAYTDAIGAKAPDLSKEYREALTERLVEAGLDLAESNERLLREVAIYADRIDISEELTRLESHFQQAASMFRARGPQGKSLDFLAQEMCREVNTIASKANDTDIAHQVILCKTELERIREQVQNIE